MIALDSNQQALIDGGYKQLIWRWVVDIGGDSSGIDPYYWSTRDTPDMDSSYGHGSFTYKVIEFNNLTMRRGGNEAGIIAPDEVTITIENEDESLNTDDFKDARITMYLSLDDGNGNEDVIRTWSLNVKKPTAPHKKKITLICEDILQKHLRGDYPNTRLIDDIFPSDDQKGKDNLCVPVPFGTAYVPLRSVYITDQRYYMLGLASYSYTINAVHSPAEMPGQSEWESGEEDSSGEGDSSGSLDYVFTQSTKADGDSVNWRVFQPIIADSDSDGAVDACGLFRPGDEFLDMPTKFTRDDTAALTDPGDVIKFVLEDMGVPSDDIDIPSFDAASAIFSSSSWNLEWNGAFWRKRLRAEVLAQLLTMCNSVIIVGEKIELHVLSKIPVETLVAADIMRPRKAGESSFKYNDVVNETDTDSAYVAISETDKPQGRLLKVIVPVKSSFEYPSDETIEMPFVQDAEHAQNLACLHYQRKFLKKADVSFNGMEFLLAVQPDDIITIPTKYGGSYDVLVNSITFNKDLTLSFSCTRFKEALDDWEDLSFSGVTFVVDDTTGAWETIIIGPDTTLSGNNQMNVLRGRLRVGATNNYILLDPAEPIIKLDEGGTDRVLIGDLGGNNFGIQINNAGGNMVMKIDGSSAVLAGWNITTTTLTKNNATLDSAGKLTLGTNNDVIILNAVDATYRIWVGHATGASAPFRVTKGGALTATGATITGTITATAGVIGGFTVNAAEGLYAGSGATRVQMKPGVGIWTGATAIGDAPFSVTKVGVLKAESGTIGGFTLSTTQLYAGAGATRIQLDTGVGIWLGATLIGDAPFYITKAGVFKAVSGTIGGFTLSSSQLYAGSGATRIQLDTGQGFWLGATAFGDAPFYVSRAGALTAKSGTIGGWTLASDKISIAGIELDQANNRIRAYTGSNYVDLTAGGLTGYDSVLGTVFRLFTDGSAPEFSSGIIKECVYEIYTSGVIKTAADPTATGGLIINSTSLRGYDDTPTKLLEFIYSGTDKGDAYIGDYDNANEGLKYDHSAGILYYRGQIIITGGSGIGSLSDAGALAVGDDLDDVPDGSTYGRAQLGVLDGGYLYLLRKDADTTERLEVTASGLEGYANNVKNFELASGIAYLGDQANEHIKLSSSGLQIYDGATLYATYATTTTIGLVASEHISIDNTKIEIKDGANVYTNLAAGILQLGLVSGGEYIQIDSTGIEGYGNAVKLFELTNAGLAYFGDQSNEHIKLSSSGLQIYDGATLYATYAATTTIGLVASEHISISATAVQLKDGATVLTEISGGNVFIGDQANEHIKLSSSGFQVYDGATLYATYGATTTIGLIASEHLSISATAIQLKDGATVLTEISGGNVLVGRTGAGQSNVYITGGAISLRNNVTDVITLSSTGVVGITVKGGGGITLEAGGDITLAPSDANPALIKWSTVHNFGAATTTARGLCIWPTTANQDYFHIGWDIVNNVAKKYRYIRFYAESNFAIYVNNTTLSKFRITNLGEAWFRAHVYPTDNNTYNLGGAGKEWKHGWMVDLTVTNNLVVGGTITTGQITHTAVGSTKQYVAQASLADEASLYLPNATYGWGFVSIGNKEHYALFQYSSAAVVTLISNSAMVRNTNSDTYFCVYDDGTQVRLKNRLGSTKNVSVIVFHM